MQVFVTGATGVLGRRLVDELADEGHEVTGLVRDDAGERLVAELGGTPQRGDVLDPGSLSGAIPADVDVLVHAATAIPTSTKPTEEDWARNDRVREEGISTLLDVAGDRVDRVVFPSVVWLARRSDGRYFDEDAARTPTRSTRSAAAAEELLKARAADAPWDPLVLRFGYFYAPDASHTRLFGERLLDRNLPIVGGGLLGRRDAALSWIHADDAAAATATAIDQAVTGLYHVVDDEPATVAAFLQELADRLGAPAPRRVPAWLARFVVGSETAALFSNPMPTSNDAFADATGWEPEHPTYRDGLAQVVDDWLEAGVLAETSEGYEWTATA